MIQTRKAVLKKPDSRIYVIAAVIALMIAWNGLNNNESVTNLDGVLLSPGQIGF